MKTVFVTGTDTGVGKTHIAAGLARRWRADGVRVGVCKPVESGCADAAPQDATALLAAAQSGQSPDEVCPYRLRAPLAPSEAARLEGVTIDFAALIEHIRQISTHFDVLLVEGAGGILVPLTAEKTFLDLAAALSAPTLVVAGNKLGCINHTLLTVRALSTAGVEVAGVVLNDMLAQTTPDMPGNMAVIDSMTPEPVFGVWPHDAAKDPARAERTRQAIAEAIRRSLGFRLG